MFNLFDVDWVSPMVHLLGLAFNLQLCLYVCYFLYKSICVFRFFGLSSYVFQYWSPGILSGFSCSSTAFYFINYCLGLLPVVKSIASIGVVSTAPVISLRPGSELAPAPEVYVVEQ